MILLFFSISQSVVLNIYQLYTPYAFINSLRWLECPLDDITFLAKLYKLSKWFWKGWQGLKRFKNNLSKQVNSDNMKIFAQCRFHFNQGQHCFVTGSNNQQNTTGSYFDFSRGKHWQILDKEEKCCSFYLQYF